MMVSEESSVGHDPARVVYTMEQIIREAERLTEKTHLPNFSSSSNLCELADAIAPAVYGIAASLAARSRQSTIINVSAHSGKVIHSISHCPFVIAVLRQFSFSSSFPVLIRRSSFILHSLSSLLTLLL